MEKVEVTLLLREDVVEFINSEIGRNYMERGFPRDEQGNPQKLSIDAIVNWYMRKAKERFEGRDLNDMKLRQARKQLTAILDLMDYKDPLIE